MNSCQERFDPNTLTPEEAAEDTRPFATAEEAMAHADAWLYHNDPRPELFGNPDEAFAKIDRVLVSLGKLLIGVTYDRRYVWSPVQIWRNWRFVSTKQRVGVFKTLEERADAGNKE